MTLTLFLATCRGFCRGVLSLIDLSQASDLVGCDDYVMLVAAEFPRAPDCRTAHSMSLFSLILLSTGNQEFDGEAVLRIDDSGLPCQTWLGMTISVIKAVAALSSQLWRAVYTL